LTFTKAFGGATAVAATNTYTADVWVSTVCVYGYNAGADDMTVVLDGDWANRGTTTTTKSDPVFDQMYIGALVRPTPSNHFNGDLAEVYLIDAEWGQVECEAFDHGYHPELISPGKILQGTEIWGNNSPEPGYGGLPSWTLQVGTPAKAPHPPNVILPAPVFYSFPSTAAGGSVTYESVVGTAKLTGQTADILQQLFFDSVTGTLKLQGVTADRTIDTPYEATPADLKLAAPVGDIKISYNFDAQVGTLTLAGQTADVLQEVLYDAQTGTLTLTGQTADLLQQVLFDGTPGILKLQGIVADQQIVSDIAYEAVAGALKLVGITAEQDVSGSVAYEPTIGTLILAGQAGEFVFNLEADAVAGQLKLVGATADVLQEIRYDATPGTLGLAGQAAEFSIPLAYESVIGQLRLSGLQGDFVIPGLAVAAAPAPSGVRRRYPKRIQILGKRYTVRSEYEERRRLREIIEEEQAKAERAEERQELKTVTRARVRIKRTERRLQQLDESPDFRRAWDEELVMIMADDPWL
jgi:hypothetical protein